LTFSTIDKSFEGLYDFKIKVTESVSGLTNLDVAFSIEMTVKIYALEMNLILATVISDQNYLVADPAMILLAYMYDFVPSNAVLDVHYSFTSAPSFVQLIDSTGIWIQVLTSDPNDTGIYTIEVLTVDNESSF
jgi:hypothetical protein